jgi:hypothetical protein
VRFDRRKSGEPLFCGVWSEHVGRSVQGPDASRGGLKEPVSGPVERLLRGAQAVRRVKAITSRPYSDHAPTDLLPQVTSPRPVYGSAKRARH